MTDVWLSSVASITERNLFELDLAVRLELELVSYCFELKTFLILFLSLAHLNSLLFLFLIIKIAVSSILIGLKDSFFFTNLLAKLLSDSLLLDSL